MKTLLLTLLVFFSLFTSKVNASNFLISDFFPIEVTLPKAKGATWLHVNGHPMQFRYNFVPTSGKYCTFEAGIYHYVEGPKENFLQLKLTYYDSQMVEDKGKVEVFHMLNWQPTAEQPSPFVPTKPWTSNSEVNHTVSQVTYDKENYTTHIYGENKHMIYTENFTTVTTTPDFKTVTRVKMSWDTYLNTPEADRNVVVDCFIDE